MRAMGRNLAIGQKNEETTFEKSRFLDWGVEVVGSGVVCVDSSVLRRVLLAFRAQNHSS